MIRTLFFGLQEAKKAARAEGCPGAGVQEDRRAGAGLMGSGIDTVSAGRPRHSADRQDQARDDRGKGAVRASRQAGEARPLVQARRDGTLAKVTATPTSARSRTSTWWSRRCSEPRASRPSHQEGRSHRDGNGGVRLQHLDPPITGLAKHRPAGPTTSSACISSRRSRKLPLVEIIVGKKTSPETLARSMDFVQKDPQTRFVVNASRGFLRAACAAIHQRGPSPAEGGVPAAMMRMRRYAACRVGRCRLNGRGGVDLSWKIMDQTRRRRAPRGHKYERLGHRGHSRADGKSLSVRAKERQGLLRLSGRRKKRLWPELRILPGQPELSTAGEGEDKARQGGPDQESALYVPASTPPRWAFEADVLTAPRTARRFDHGHGLAPADRRAPSDDRNQVGVNSSSTSATKSPRVRAEFEVAKLLRDMAAKRPELYGKTAAKAA